VVKVDEVSTTNLLLIIIICLLVVSWLINHVR